MAGRLIGISVNRRKRLMRGRIGLQALVLGPQSIVLVDSLLEPRNKLLDEIVLVVSHGRNRFKSSLAVAN